MFIIVMWIIRRAELELVEFSWWECAAWNVLNVSGVSVLY